MESGRTYPDQFLRKKPKIVFDRAFPDINTLEVGNRGQIDVEIEVAEIAMIETEDGDSIKSMIYHVNKAELIKNLPARL